VYKVVWGPTGVDETGALSMLVSSFRNQTGYQFQQDVTEQSLWRFSRNAQRGTAARAGFYQHLLLDHSFGFVYLPRFVFAVSKNASSSERFPAMLLWASESGGLNMRQAEFPADLNVGL
jgi:hypothetical protein